MSKFRYFPILSIYSRLIPDFQKIRQYGHVWNHNFHMACVSLYNLPLNYWDQVWNSPSPVSVLLSCSTLPQLHNIDLGWGEGACYDSIRTIPEIFGLVSVILVEDCWYDVYGLCSLENLFLQLHMWIFQFYAIFDGVYQILWHLLLRSRPSKQLTYSRLC